MPLALAGTPGPEPAMPVSLPAGMAGVPVVTVSLVACVPEGIHCFLRGVATLLGLAGL